MFGLEEWRSLKDFLTSALFFSPPRLETFVLSFPIFVDRSILAWPMLMLQFLL